MFLGGGAGGSTPAVEMYRLGVAVHSLTAPAWIAHVIRTLNESSYARVDILIECPKAAEKTSLPLSRRLYDSFDAPTLTRNARAPVDLAPLIGDVPVITRGEVNVDMLLDFTGHAANHISTRPRLGIWTLEIGGFPEFAAQEPSTTARLKIAGGPCNGMSATTSTATDDIHLSRSLNRLYWKSGVLILEEMERLHKTGCIGGPMDIREDLPRCKPASPSRVLFSAAARKIGATVRERLMREQWFVAYGHARHEPRSLKTLMPPRDRLWADPFVVADGDRAVVFIEEMLYADERGAIACFEIDGSGEATMPRRVLVRPYHLSYPCVFSWNGERFMVPETSANRTIELYRCTRFPFEWKLERVLMADLHAVDSTIFEYGGLWWMYTTTSADGSWFETLRLHYAETPLGPWQPHAMNPLLRHPAGGRCAGRPFLRDGTWMRAAQNGCRRYGHSIQLREIVTLTPDRWEERVVGGIAPDWRRGLAGTHTLNVDGEFKVIDGLQYSRRTFW